MSGFGQIIDAVRGFSTQAINPKIAAIHVPRAPAVGLAGRSDRRCLRGCSRPCEIRLAPASDESVAAAAARPGWPAGLELPPTGSPRGVGDTPASQTTHNASADKVQKKPPQAAQAGDGPQHPAGKGLPAGGELVTHGAYKFPTD